VRVVVSGSSGLIGRALVEQVRRHGHEVVTLVRRAAGQGEVQWDPESGWIDPGALERADAVVNLSGAGIGDRRWSAARRNVIVSSRVASTELLARTAAGLDHAPEVLLNASAVGYYGTRGGDAELTEDSPAGDGYLAELCVAWENATEAAERAGVRVIRWRSGVVLSPSGGALARMLPLFRLGLGGVLGSGSQWLSWISLYDEVHAMLYALAQTDLRGPVNGCAPNPVTNREFTRTLGYLLHRPTIAAVPRLVLEAVLGRDLAAEVPLASQRAVPARLTAAGYHFEHPTVAEALEAAVAAPRPD
jgi:hypothetical protein